MKDKSKLKLKMISSLLTCALSLFSLITLTLSWFAMNKDADAGGMGALIKASSIVAECEYYVVDSETEESGYVFVTPAADSGYVLGSYDILKDKYQFLLKVKLTSEMVIDVIARTETDYFLGSATAENGLWLTESGEGNTLSSVVSFSVLSQDNLPTKTANGYKLNDLPADPVCFFDGNADDIAASLQKTPSIANGLSVTADENGDAVFFILLSYDPLLISTVFSANIGNGVIEREGEEFVVPFVLDFEILLTAAE